METSLEMIPAVILKLIYCSILNKLKKNNKAMHRIDINQQMLNIVCHLASEFVTNRVNYH